MNWSIRVQAITGLAAVVALIVGVGIWGSLATLAGAVIAAGQVAPQSRAQVIQHQDGGIVAHIGVGDGDTVRAGDVLLVLDGGDLRSSHAILTAQIAELGARAARLAAEQLGADSVSFPADLADLATRDAAVGAVLAGQQALFDARQQTYIQSVKALREQQRQKASEIEGLEAQVSALGEQLGLIEEELADVETLLDKKLVNASQVAALRRARADLVGEKAAAEASVAAGFGQIAELDTDVLRLTSTRAQEAVSELRDVENKLNELEEERKALEVRMARLDMRAPLDGIVHGLAVHTIGSVVRPAEPVMYVIPQDDQPTITARIDAQHVDSVHVGQPAVLRFTSFDARTTPELEATVTLLSADVVTDERSGLQFYTAEVTPTSGEFTKLGDKDLLPGMPVEIHIQTGGRSPLSYMFKPFTDYVERAFRE